VTTTNAAIDSHSPAGSALPGPDGWTPMSWKERLEAQQVRYTDREAVDRAAARLASLPPLVTSFEIDRLREEISQAQRGERFVLQGGDCAEMIAECEPTQITAKLKILLQMSLVLVSGTKRPVTRIGRIAGQYAKPRSSPTETGVYNGQEIELPSYFGDLVNGFDFTPEAREPRPERMIEGYLHASVTLNFIRSLLDGGLADLHHPEQWDLRFMDHPTLTAEHRARYEAAARDVSRGLELVEALGERPIGEISHVEFFTSHEGLNLLYESSQTRRVPRKEGHYDLTCHLPWIGERTRQLDGAHVEFFRGIRNPVGLKVGPKADPGEILEVITRLNPTDEPGKIMLIPRMGAELVEERLPALLRAIDAGGRRVMWSCDPMHGNGIKTEGGIKTRSFDAIRHECEATIDAHRKVGTVLGGIHFELTGEDVTECVGGARNVTEDELGINYVSLCDPRLNYDQAMELAFIVAEKLAGERASPRQ